MKAIDADIMLAKVDATEEKTLATQFAIQGFPTLKWFVDGKEAMDYSGGRTASEIVAWIKKRTGPPCTEIKTTADVEAAKAAEVSMVAYLEKLEGEENDAFDSLASKTEDAMFYKTTDGELAKSFGIEAAPGFAVGRNYSEFGFEVVSDKGHTSMKGDDDLGQRLAAFLNAEKVPAFLEFSQAAGPRIFGSGIDHQVIVVAPGKSFEAMSALYKDLTTASGATRGKVMWVTAKVDSEGAGPVINFFGLDKDSKETQVVGYVTKPAAKKFMFPASEKVTADSLEKFGLSVVDGTASPFVKSAKVPEEPTDEGVTVVVGSTFDSIVKDPTKDVLLEVYAPWCGHCKSLAPKYAELAKRLKDVPSVVVAKMDGTENEVPDLQVQGFPTLVFFPAAEDVKPIPYEGDREVKDMIKFIKKNAQVKFELPKKSKKAKEAKSDEEAKEAEHDEL